MKVKDYYFILGITNTASLSEVKSAFRACALRWHPDRHKDSAKRSAHRKFIEIVEAYEILSDISRRKEYDSYRYHARSSGASVASSKDTSYGADGFAVDWRQVRRHIINWRKNARKQASAYTRLSLTAFIRLMDSFKEAFAQGVDYARQKMRVRDQSVESCRDVLRKDPYNVDAYYGLGFLFFKEGKLEESARCYRRALKLAPDDPDVFYGLGLARLESGDERRAVNCFSRVVELDSGDAEAYYHLGRIYSKNGMKDKACQCADNLRSLNRLDLAEKVFSCSINGGLD